MPVAIDEYRCAGTILDDLLHAMLSFEAHSRACAEVRLGRDAGAGGQLKDWVRGYL